MKRRGVRLAAVILMTCLVLTNGWSQDSPQEIRQVLEHSIGEVVRVKTEGRGEFQGILLSIDGERIEIQNHEGQVLEVVLDTVTEVFVIDPEAGRDTYFQDAAANKLILMPVGFGMDPGEFHIADQELIIVSASYGFSEHFSMWGALSIPGFLFNARLSTSIGDTIGLSAGSFLGAIFLEWGHAFAMPYVISSFGSLNQNFTVGAAAPFYIDIAHEIPLTPGTEDTDGTHRLSTRMVTGGIVALGGKIVLSQTASIVTESWIGVLTDYWDGAWRSPAVYAIPTVAFRIAGSRFSADIGIGMGMYYAETSEDNWEEFEAGAEYARTYGEYEFGWVTDMPIPIPILSVTYRIR